MVEQILICVNSQEAEKILNGKQTLLLRKTIPKDYKGWVNLYVTKAKPYLYKSKLLDYVLIERFLAETNLLNGKVVARFWFDEHDMIVGEWRLGKSIFSYRNLTEEQVVRLCLAVRDIFDYGDEKDLYVWHIKNLQIFKEPKEINEFHNDYGYKRGETFLLDMFKLKRPPSTWQYVYAKKEQII